MNAQPETPADIPDKVLSDALISLCGLAPEAVEQITETMRTANLGFSDAALHIGLVTHDQVDDAIAWARRLAARDSGGLIERAIRQAQGGARIVVHQGEPVQPGRQLVLVHDPGSARSERIRALRTEMMLLMEGERRGNAIALMSPSAGEGRSQLCADLAIAFAQLRRRTLLIDADLRHPRQHLLFNSANEFGLAQALVNGESALLHPVEGVADLTLLTAGAVPSNPQELLADSRFEQLMGQWRRSYDFIVIDTPPVAQFADALAIATIVGRVLVLSRKETTSFSEMKDMLRRLAPTQAKILGAVLSAF